MEPSRCLVDHVASVNAEKEKAFAAQTKQFESTSQWLADAIQSCKRKVLEGTGHELIESKRIKSAVKEEARKPDDAKVKPAPSAPAPAPVEEHPEYSRIMSLKVVELRQELRSLELDASGRKNELQTRLLEYVVSREPAREISKSEAGEKTKAEGVVEEEKPPVADLMELDTAASNEPAPPSEEIADVEMTKPAPVETKAPASSRTEEPKRMCIDNPVEEKVPEKSAAASFLKSTASRLFSPSKSGVAKLKEQSPEKKASAKKAPAPLRTAVAQKLVKQASNLFSPSKPDSDRPDKSKSAVSEPDVKTKSSSTENPERKIAAAKEMTSSGSVKAPAVKESSIKKESATPAVNASIVGVPSVSLSAKTKAKELAEARKARLAEIRGKSKPVTLSGPGSSVEKPSAPSASRALTKSAAPPEKKQDDRRNLLAAQMREKAAAAGKSKFEKSSGSQNPVSSQNRLIGKPFGKKQQPFATTTSSLAAQKSRAVNPSPAPKQKARTLPVAAAPSPKTKVSASPAVHRKNGVKASPAPLKKAAPKPLRSALRDVKAEHRHKVLSPMDTYEISDRSDSDESDSEDSYENRKPRKKIPEWAQKHNLIAALERQLGEDGQNRLNPDFIFPEVETCNLEEIFDRKKTRYKSRTSSGNWTKDRVTVHEKLIYSRSMGYNE